MRFFPYWNPFDANQVIGFLNMINHILSIRPEIINCLEIGSHLGESTSLILGFPQIKNIYCVDSWKDKNVKYIFDKRLSNTQCKIIHMTSDQASNTLSLPLDMVYLDADHSYDSVSLDIKMWYPKIISGGFLCGHDYWAKWPGCQKAIDEFVDSNKLEISFFQDSSWVIQKP